MHCIGNQRFIACAVCMIWTMLALPLAGVSQQIGIFDLTAIRAVPLNPQIVNKVEAGGIITEEIRFTSRPGVSVFAYISYPKGAKKLAGNMIIRNHGAESRVADARTGFVGISVCPPSGNTDPKKKETVGGPPFKDDFMDNPEESWIYHHVVALTRMIDYLETRPEVDVKRLLVMGYSWSGWICALLHAIENRPAVFVSWHSAGYYADEQGMSGDRPSQLSRKLYEMYAPSAYARHGTQPIFIASALTDFFSTLDALITFYNGLQSPKALAVAPNRYHAHTMRNEYRGSAHWGWHWQGGGRRPPVVAPGKVSAHNGRLLYTFSVNSSVPLTAIEVLYSFGEPGHWVGRTWHRKAAQRAEAPNTFVCELPLYDPVMPLYAVAQVETATLGATANAPQYIDPVALGLTTPTAVYPKMLFDFETLDDLYIPAGTLRLVPDAAEGKSAGRITPFDDGSIHLMNIEPFFWKDAREIRFWLKGDGRKGPVELYVVFDANYFLYRERGNFTKITLVPADAMFEPRWQEFVVPLRDIKNADQIDSLFFVVDGKRDLLIDGIRWQ